MHSNGIEKLHQICWGARSEFSNFWMQTVILVTCRAHALINGDTRKHDGQITECTSKREAPCVQCIGDAQHFAGLSVCQRSRELNQQRLIHTAEH